MKKLVLLLFGVMLLAACSGIASESASTQQQSGESPAYHKITAEQAKQIMDEGLDYTLLDVRTKEEYDALRIEGALLIPDDQIKNRAEALLPDKNARILVYCRSGRRSAGAANQLLKMGYTQIYDFGGINDWPYETVSGE